MPISMRPIVPTDMLLVNDDGQVVGVQPGGRGVLPTYFGSAVIVQTARPQALIDLAQSDNGTVMPVTNASVDVTVIAGLGSRFAAIVRRDNDGTLDVVAGAGVTLIFGGASVASVTVTKKGSYVSLLPGSVPNEYFVTVSGE